MKIQILAPETKAELININAQELAESEAKRERLLLMLLLIKI